VIVGSPFSVRCLSSASRIGLLLAKALADTTPKSTITTTASNTSAQQRFTLPMRRRRLASGFADLAVALDHRDVHPADMAVEPQTWHYGLIAKWWAEFNHGGPEIDYFGRWVAEGQPALDAGCGTGRLLLPWLRAGYAVDGCDVSADMVEVCRRRAAADGRDPTLFVSPLHTIDPPRRYRTIVACGVFGLGSTRAQDEQALVRLREALEPGGTLLLDNEVPYADERTWTRWTKEGRGQLPQEWREPGERRRASDGSELSLVSRTVSFDPVEQRAVVEMRAEEWRDGALAKREEHAITLNIYFTQEIVLMLRAAGFADVDVRGEYVDRPPTADDHVVVFVART
jgi:SAM-dependent methyltransferase